MAAILVAAWQIGSVVLEKQNITYMLQEQANSAKKSYKHHETIPNNVRKNLKLKGLPTEFSFEVMENRKVKIVYRYKGAATIFGYTYYQTDEIISVVTPD